MRFKMLMWTILVLGSYLQGAYADNVSSISPTNITPMTTSIIPSTAIPKPSLVESSSQSTPTTISIAPTNSLPSQLPSTEPAAKPGTFSASTNSPPTEAQNAPVSSQTSEGDHSTATLASSIQLATINVTDGPILTSNVTNGTVAPSVQSTLKNSADTVTPSSTTEFKLTSSTTSVPVILSTTDEHSATNSQTEKSHATTHVTTATTTSAAVTTSATTTTSAAPATSSSATSSSAAATSSATTTTTSAAAAAIRTTSSATTTTTSAAAIRTTEAAATTTTTTRTAAAAATTVTTTTVTTISGKPLPRATEPKLSPSEVTPNSNGTNYEKLCALLSEINGGTGNCTMNGYNINGVFRVTSIQPSLPSEKVTEKPKADGSSVEVQPTAQSDESQMTLIAILASCSALALILIAFAVYCSYHRLSYRKNQQHLTEEMQTVENGYHDNPTLDVMEVQPEVQEKKLALNGEFNDSWIVPFDNLGKDDIPDEEDTHL